MHEKFTNQLNKIIFILIKGTIFLLPLFFLPWTSEYFEFNKQFLLWLVMPPAALLWLYQAVRRGQLKIKFNPLNLPILIFLLLTAAASIFSLDGFSSWFGHFGRFSDAWLGLLSLIIFYFLIINTDLASSAEKIIGLLKLLFYSTVVVAVLSLAARLGWLALTSGDPFSILSSTLFNPAGDSPLNLGIFLAITSVIPAGFLFMPAPNSARGFSGGLKKIDSLIFGLGLIVSLIILALVNFSLSWALIFAGAVLIIFFRWLAAGSNFKKFLDYSLLIPAVLIVLAVFFLAWPKADPAKIIFGQELPQEARLGYSQAWIITRDTLKTSPALGSGPGTFAEDFSLYRPAELNSSAFWQVRFNKSGSQFLEMLATDGLLSGLSYFLIICLISYLNIILIKRYLIRPSGEPAPLTAEDYNLIVVLLTIFILSFCSQFFISANTVLNFIFWLAAGLIIAFWQSHNQILFKEKIFDLSRSVLLRRLMVLTLFILSAGVVALLAFEIKFFAADIIAARGSYGQNSLMTAIKLNPHRYHYQISLAKLYLNQARAEAAKPAGPRDDIKIQTNITQAIEIAKQASATAPNSVLAQETLGMIYRDIGPLTLGSEPWAVKYFEQALALEPTNPVLATELAKAYGNTNDFTSAEIYFKKALVLKNDYYEAKFGLAKIYLSGKRDNQALALLNELAREVKSSEVYYELGRYYYNHGEVEKAVDRFKLALSLSPRHANSLSGLAMAYEAKGDLTEALRYYKQVFELDRSNAEVEKKIKELSK